MVPCFEQFCIVLSTSITSMFHFFADFQLKIQQNPKFDQALNDQIDEILAEDLYYLLQSFSAMALAREKCDWDFIIHVTIDLLKVCNYPAIFFSSC
jgi:hypothetical protein